MQTPSIVEALKIPSQWPCWPYLPLKNTRDRKPGEFPKLAVIIEKQDMDGSDFRFIECANMYMLTADDIAASVKADAKQLERNGWVVD